MVNSCEWIIALVVLQPDPVVDEEIDWWSKYYASTGQTHKCRKYVEKGQDKIEVSPPSPFPSPGGSPSATPRQVRLTRVGNTWRRVRTRLRWVPPPPSPPQGVVQVLRLDQSDSQV